MLKLTRTREFVINMGNYESFRTSATVEIESYDIETAEGKAEILLDEALKDDLLSAANLSDVRNTYILTWNKEKYDRDN